MRTINQLLDVLLTRYTIDDLSKDHHLAELYRTLTELKQVNGGNTKIHVEGRLFSYVTKYL